MAEILTLNALRLGLMRSKAFSGTVAEAAAKAIESVTTQIQEVKTVAQQATEEAQKAQETASSCENKPFTIPADSWAQLDTPKGACKFSADISIDGITAADTADVIFSVDCFDTLATASVSTGGETGEDKVTVYAVTAPTVTLTGSIIIYKGGV